MVSQENAFSGTRPSIESLDVPGRKTNVISGNYYATEVSTDDTDHPTGHYVSIEQ